MPWVTFPWDEQRMLNCQVHKVQDTHSLTTGAARLVVQISRGGMHFSGVVWCGTTDSLGWLGVVTRVGSYDIKVGINYNLTM